MQHKMIRSMTGFGHGEACRDSKKIIVEMKAVNHRYLDTNIRSPKSFSQFEGFIRSYLTNRLNRGKVDVFVTYEEQADSKYTIQYNQEIAKMYYDNIQKIASDFDVDGSVNAASLSRYPDVFEIKEAEEDADELQALLKEALDNACDSFIKNRETEGKRLADDLLSKLDELAGYVDHIEARSPEIIEEYKNKLKAKISDLLDDNQIDENRIALEVTLYADKICVDEEIIRLKSHIQEMKDELTQGSEDGIGRKLDFVTQEMNREANTTLSKSTNVEIANIGIEMKTLIEKIREQIQNIE